MKKTISLIAFFMLTAYAGFATVRTVSNHPAGGSQYTSLQTAYNASTNGDTLLIEGTDIPYFMTGCPFVWAKSLTVIGIGFNPNKQLPKRTVIRNTDCDGVFHIGSGGSGSSFYGIEFSHGVYVSNGPLNNISFENCKFNVYFNFACNSTTNFAFRNCIFDNDNGLNLAFGQCNNAATGLVSNCVFDGYVEGNNCALAAVVFEHCIYFSTAGTQIFNNVRYADIRNNIFVNRFPTGSFSSNYQNNICAVAGTFPPSPANGNTASGNIENTNPLFTTYTSGAFYSSLHDYDVQAGSVANNAATNGTDIGVHGGYTNFSESGETLINPIIRAMTILNTSVSSNGTLNVQLHAAKPATN